MTILGQTPAQKNNKQLFRNSRTGKMFITSSNTVKSWQAQALSQLEGVSDRFTSPVRVSYDFYVKDNRPRDLDNMMASVNDILQAANSDHELYRGKPRIVKGTGIIIGDHWQVLEVGHAKASIDKENPRVEVTIELL